MHKTLRLLRGDANRFVKKILRAEPDSWQEDVLKSLSKSARVAVRSGHGVGKSCLEAWAVLWFLMTRPYCKVICTAPTIQQLYKVLWSELAKWLQRSELLKELFEWQKTQIIFRGDSARWFAAARTASKPENLAGFHEESILFVLDEASGITDEIFEAVEGALTTRDAKLLLCGNPTKNSGFFKRAFFEDRELYQTFKVSSAESARVTKEYAERLIRQYGAGSDVVRVRVFGEFPKAQADGLIPLELVEAAMAREPVFNGELAMGVDVARFGDDLTVLVARVGDSVALIKHWSHADLMTTSGRIIRAAKELLNKYKARSISIRVDDSGLGGGVTDRLKELVAEQNLPAQIKPCLNNAKPRDSKYANFVTEAYFALKERFEQGNITLPRDDALSAELTLRRFSVNSSDKIILERKEDFKRRLKRSPDRADALSLCFAPLTTLVKIPQMPLVQSYWKM